MDKKELIQKVSFGESIAELGAIKLEDYLFTNTKLETASSTRHEFGKIYEENEQLYFKLNLQIRFK